MDMNRAAEAAAVDVSPCEPEKDIAKDMGWDLSPSGSRQPYTPTSAGSHTSDDLSRYEMSASEPGQSIMDLPKNQQWRAYLSQDIVHGKMLTLELIFLYFITGIIDAMTFVSYRIFTTKQTGNTIFLALASAESEAVQQVVPNVGMAMATFCAGSVIFGHVGNLFGKKRRSWLMFSEFFQTCLIFGATALRYWGNKDKTGPHALGVIALLSFASGGQVALPIGLGIPELNTTMITAALVSLANDRNIFKKFAENRRRNRLVGAYLAFLGGAYVGATTNEFCWPAVTLLVAGIGKMCVIGMFLFNGGHEHNKPGPPESMESTRSSITLSRVFWGD
ncbi:hypothetical protein LTR66_009730 [Elasticomyces elasticus]|nr:hypothetical protein LTR66_009730 [Elasticomyces elasticus]